MKRTAKSYDRVMQDPISRQYTRVIADAQASSIKNKPKGLFARAFFITCGAHWTMNKILAAIAGHPQFDYAIIGLEPYPTDPTNWHYHILLCYATRVFIPFERMPEMLGTQGRWLIAKSDLAVATYCVKGGRGAVAPPSRYPFVQRVCPEILVSDTWTADQAESMEDLSDLNGPLAIAHTQFWILNNPV